MGLRKSSYIILAHFNQKVDPRYLLSIRRLLSCVRLKNIACEASVVGAVGGDKTFFREREHRNPFELFYRVSNLQKRHFF